MRIARRFVWPGRCVYAGDAYAVKLFGSGNGTVKEGMKVLGDQGIISLNHNPSQANAFQPSEQNNQTSSNHLFFTTPAS